MARFVRDIGRYGKLIRRVLVSFVPNMAGIVSVIIRLLHALARFVSDIERYGAFST